MIRKIAQYTFSLIRPLVLSVCCLAFPAQADISPDLAGKLPQKTYDLDSRHGVLAVYERIQAIAEHHCVANTNLAKALTPKERACRDRVLNLLLSKLADPYLSYLHENPEAQRVAKR